MVVYHLNCNNNGLISRGNCNPLLICIFRMRVVDRLGGEALDNISNEKRTYKSKRWFIAFIVVCICIGGIIIGKLFYEATE